MRISLAVTSVVVLLLGGLAPQQAKAWDCWKENGKNVGEFAKGLCLPYPDVRGDPKLRPDHRKALYIRCRVAGQGVDEYTNNCCDHLTDGDAGALKVCRHRNTNFPEGLERDILIDKITNLAKLYAKYTSVEAAE